MVVLLLPCLRSKHHALVKVRCGVQTLNDVGMTFPVIGGGKSPQWTHKHRHAMRIKRHRDDNSMLVVEV